MLSELAYCHIRCCLSAIPPDLMKYTAVDKGLSSMNQQFCSRENQLLQMLQQNEKSCRSLVFSGTVHWFVGRPMYCSREYQTSTRLNQQYEKSTLKMRNLHITFFTCQAFQNV